MRDLDPYYGYQTGSIEVKTSSGVCQKRSVGTLLDYPADDTESSVMPLPAPLVKPDEESEAHGRAASKSAQINKKTEKRIRQLPRRPVDGSYPAAAQSGRTAVANHEHRQRSALIPSRAMKVFISWSGEQSRQVALALHE
jgi:hypothetical protein